MFAVKAKQLGFFTRLLDQVEPGERYRLAAEQICCAEQQGFDSAWVAQHHFVEAEGGLPAPFVFLAHVAAQTSRIRLGTGIVTLPLEMPLRVAEDASVLDLLCGVGWRWGWVRVARPRPSPRSGRIVMRGRRFSRLPGDRPQCVAGPGTGCHG